MIKIRPTTKYTKTLDRITDKLDEADDEIEKFNIYFEKQAAKKPLTNTEKKNLENMDVFRKRLIEYKNELYHIMLK